MLLIVLFGRFCSVRTDEACTSNNMIVINNYLWSLGSFSAFSFCYSSFAGNHPGLVDLSFSFLIDLQICALYDSRENTLLKHLGGMSLSTGS